MALRSQIKFEDLLAWLEVTSNSAKRKACEPSPRGATLSPALPYRSRQRGFRLDC